MQMGEHRPLQVLVDVHLHIHGLIGKEDDPNGLGRDDPQICQGEAAQPLQGVLLDKSVDRIPLEEGEDDVDQSGEEDQPDDQHEILR